MSVSRVTRLTGRAATTLVMTALGVTSLDMRTGLPSLVSAMAGKSRVD